MNLIFYFKFMIFEYQDFIVDENYIDDDVDIYKFCLKFMMFVFNEE